MPLKILSYDELYGWTMDAIVAQIGKKNNCTFCGVFRRQALDRGAAILNVDHIVTGHNADDIAETVLMNSTFPSTWPRTPPNIFLQSCEVISHVLAAVHRYVPKGRIRLSGPSHSSTPMRRR